MGGWQQLGSALGKGAYTQACHLPPNPSISDVPQGEHTCATCKESVTSICTGNAHLKIHPEENGIWETLSFPQHFPFFAQHCLLGLLRLPMQHQDAAVFQGHWSLTGKVWWHQGPLQTKPSQMNPSQSLILKSLKAQKMISFERNAEASPSLPPVITLDFPLQPNNPFCLSN